MIHKVIQVLLLIKTKKKPTTLFNFLNTKIDFLIESNNVLAKITDKRFM